MEGKPLCEKTVAFFKSLPQDKITYWEEGRRPIDESGQQVYAYVPFDEKPVKVLSFKTEECFVNDMEITNLNELGFDAKLYRKKPIIVIAYRLTGIDCYNTRTWPSWLSNVSNNFILDAQDGDYVIKDENGKIYLCKPDIFKKTYEAL